MAKKNLDRPQKVKTNLEELEILENLKHTLEWAIFKRLCTRYIDNLRKTSFNLLQTDENFVLRHTDLSSQADGIKNAIKMVENAGKRAELERKKEKKEK